MRLIIKKFVKMIFLCFFCTKIFSQDFPQIRANGDVFCGEESEFLLVIKDTLPENVEFKMPEFPENVHLLSSKRFEFVEQNSIGTELHFFLKFDEESDEPIFLLPLEAKIDGKNVLFEFEPFTVQKNPLTAEPELFAEIQGEAVAGKSVILQVFVRYVSKVDSISAQLPENSIFREKSRDLGVEAFSKPAIVAQYEWTPLVSGKIDFPNIRANVRSFSNQNVALSTKNDVLFVENGVLQESQNETKSAFLENAFFEIEKKPEESFSNENAQILAELHSLERKTFPFSAARQNRRDFEKETNAPFAAREVSLPFLKCGWILCAFFFLFGILIFKRRVFAILMEFVAIFFGVFAFLETQKSLQKTAILATSILYSVPESNGEKIAVRAGTFVKIVGRANKWICVEAESFSGWTQDEKVFFIE